MIELPAPISEEQQKAVVQKLKYEYDCFKSDLAPRHRQIVRYHELYETTKRDKKEFPWPGAPLSRDTEILTREGWVRVDEIAVGDMALTREDDTGRLSWQRVEARPSVHAEFLYEFKSKSVDVRVTPAHAMVVETAKGVVSRRTAEQVWNTTGLRIPLTGLWDGEDRDTLFGLPASEVAEFIGWYLAEGSHANSGTLLIAQSQTANPEKCAHLETLFTRLGFGYSYSGNSFIVHTETMPAELAQTCRDAGNALSKRIPKWVFDLSPSLLSALLDGLVGGDGHRRYREHQTRETVEFYTSSPKLADDVQVLAALIGRRGVITSRVRKNGGTVEGGRVIRSDNPGYTVRINNKTRAKVDAAKSAIVPYNDTAYCVTVRNHAIYVRRNGIPSWTGNSNFQVPLIAAVTDSIHARIVKAVFDVDPLWVTKPRTPQAVELARVAQAYLDYWADEMGLANRLDMVIHNMLIEGVGVFKVDWVRSARQRPGGTDENGNGLDPAHYLEYEGPTGRPVPLRDFVLIPSDAPTIEDAVYVGHRVFRTHEQMLNRAAAGHYFNVQLLLDASQGDSTHERTPLSTHVIGGSGQGHGTYEETRQYEVVELYGPYDWGEGPIPTLFAFSPQHDILLRLEPCPYEYGRPPYVDFSIFRRPNLFWGRSVPELLESAQSELTALHNMRSDAIAVRVAPPVLHRLGSQWDPDEHPVAPGAAIETTDPNEIFYMNVPDVPGSLFAHEQDVLAFVERVTGMSDYFMGRSPSQNRTATEVQRVTSEGLVRMDVSVRRFQEGMKQLAWMLWWLLFQYRPYLDTFTDANAQDPIVITKDMMRPGPNGQMPFEFQPQGEQSDASKEARRQQLVFLLQTAANPLSQFYPDGIQELLREIFTAFDIQSKDKILGPSWNVLQQMLQQAAQQGFQEGVKQVGQQAGTGG